MSSTAGRFQAVLDASGIAARVVELPQSTRTAPEAAAAIGCQVAQIAKSLVFHRRDRDLPRAGGAAMMEASDRQQLERVVNLVREVLYGDWMRDDFERGNLEP